MTREQLIWMVAGVLAGFLDLDYMANNQARIGAAFGLNGEELGSAYNTALQMQRGEQEALGFRGRCSALI